MIETERTGTRKNIYPEYYEAVAAIAQPRHFPSPVNDPKWIKSATDWFVESQTALEVGSGRGEFAESVVNSGGRYYPIVDLTSQAVRASINSTNSPNLDTSSSNNRIFNWIDWAEYMREHGYVSTLLTEGPITAENLEDHSVLIIAGQMAKWF